MGCGQYTDTQRGGGGEVLAVSPDLPRIPSRRCPRMKSTARPSLLAAVAAATLVGLCPLLASAQQKKDESKPLDEPTILKSVRGPKGFDVTVFAMPPEVHYPTSISATPNGELYVAIDEQGS